MPLEKAVIINIDAGEQITVLFNPAEYSINRQVNYAQLGVPGLSAPVTQFVNNELQTLEMELFFDTYEDQSGADVRKLTDRVTGLMDINPETHAPPHLKFVWGSLDFGCLLARVQQRFTMFNPDGVPVRATLEVTFNHFQDLEKEAKEQKRETADYSKSYVVRQGESISMIATRTYGDPTLWRPIARHNRLDDPRALAVGSYLAIPPLPYRDPQTGEVFEQ